MRSRIGCYNSTRHGAHTPFRMIDVPRHIGHDELACIDYGYKLGWRLLCFTNTGRKTEWADTAEKAKLLLYSSPALCNYGRWHCPVCAWDTRLQEEVNSWSEP